MPTHQPAHAHVSACCVSCTAAASTNFYVSGAAYGCAQPESVRVAGSLSECRSSSGGSSSTHKSPMRMWICAMRVA